MDELAGAIDVDTLVIGGGAQGLTLLNELTRRGFGAVLVTNGDLGGGQTLHSHGVFNSGYAAPNPAIRASLEEDWLPFVAEHGLETYGDDRFYVVIPPAPYEQLGQAWDAAGYPYEEVTPEALPPGFRGGDLFSTGEQARVVRIEEYTVPKRGLVTALSDGLTDRIVKGDITEFHVAPANGELTIDAVDVTVHATGDTATVSPSAVVFATGTGTKRLLESLVNEPSFDAAVPSTDDPDHARTRVREQMARITHERLHMICIRGPREILPPVNLLLAADHTIVVSADVDESHRHVGGGDTITWYVTPRDPGWEHVEEVPDSAKAEPDPATVARGIDVITRAYPPLLDAATRSDSPLEFGAYAGFKQNVDDDRVAPLNEPLVGVDNAFLALPTLVGGAWLTAEATVDRISELVEPTGSKQHIDGMGTGIRVDDVRENTDAFEWLPWERFAEAHRITTRE